ncbi:MAG: hypothetical protein K0S67_223, partial [Nitrososphaeraceae archaeon]|nr:hypothetical protein [Nitrososphaeraceae archaeon]MDF2767866.1 hypothetical protein [Nitrososphaeraceae archaeon]
MINVALLSVSALLIAFGVVGMVVADPIMDIQEAEAQQRAGDITAASEGQPFGGEKMGTVTVDSDGRRTNVSADINTTPNEGNVYEGWLVDAEGSGYKLSLGQFRNGTLDFSQYMVNPYTYKNFELTEEPA